MNLTQLPTITRKNSVILDFCHSNPMTPQLKGGQVKKKRDVKGRMVSMRMTERQFQYLEDMSRRIMLETGLRVTRASIMLKLMEFGMPFLDQQFPPDGESPVELEAPKTFDLD